MCTCGRLRGPRRKSYAFINKCADFALRSGKAPWSQLLAINAKKSCCVTYLQNQLLLDVDLEIEEREGKRPDIGRARCPYGPQNSLKTVPYGYRGETQLLVH